MTCVLPQRIAAEPAEKLIFQASKNAWETTNCLLKISGSLHKFGSTYSCIKTLDVQTNSVNLIKRAKDPSQDSAEAYYDTVRAQMLASSCSERFCEAAPPACQPRFLPCHAYALVNRPNKPVVLGEQLVESEGEETSKLTIGIEPGEGAGEFEEAECHRLAALSFFSHSRAGNGLAIESVASIGGWWSCPVVHSKGGKLGGRRDQGKDGILRWREQMCRRYSPLLGVTGKHLLAMSPEELLARMDGLGLFGARGRPSLLESVFLGDLHATQSLLLAGVPADVTDSEGIGATGLIVAADQGHAAVAELLLAHRADVNARAQDGRSALVAAAMRGRVEVAGLLLGRGAAVDAAEEHGATALAMAAQRGDVGMAALLLEAGAAVDLAMENGCTALYLAARGGHVSVVELLLARGASVDFAATDGTTPLIIASIAGHVTIVDRLLRTGADAGSESQFGTAAAAAAGSEMEPAAKEAVLALLNSISSA